jgi:hypothetical protein
LLTDRSIAKTINSIFITKKVLQHAEIKTIVHNNGLQGTSGHGGFPQLNLAN